MGDRGGRSDERTVVFRLLEYVLGRVARPPGRLSRSCAAASARTGFRNGVHWTPAVAETGAHRLDKGLADAYKRELEAKPELRSGSAGWSSGSTRTTSQTTGTSARTSCATCA